MKRSWLASFALTDAIARRSSHSHSSLRDAVSRFLDHPACDYDGPLVDLVASEGDIPLGVWWSDHTDTPTVADLARLIEALREVER